MQVFLLVFIIVAGAWVFGLALCKIASDENDDEQQLEWIREQEARKRQKRTEKERKREQCLKKHR